MRWTAPRLGLRAKIFIAATLVVMGALGVTLGLTSLVANRTADESIRHAVAGVRRGVQAFLTGRTTAFAGMSALSAQVPQFRERLLNASERSNVLDQAEQYRRLLGAAWVLVTDERGVLVARTDYPSQFDVNFSRGALISNALSGEPTNGAWLDEERRRLFIAVAVPLRASPTESPRGALVAAYAIDDALVESGCGRIGRQQSEAHRGDQRLVVEPQPYLRDAATEGEVVLAFQPAQLLVEVPVPGRPGDHPVSG